MDLHTFPLTPDTIQAHAAGIEEGRAYGRLEGYEQARVLLTPIAVDLAYQLHAGHLRAADVAERTSRLFEAHEHRQRSRTATPVRPAPDRLAA